MLAFVLKSRTAVNMTGQLSQLPVKRTEAIAKIIDSILHQAKLWL